MGVLLQFQRRRDALLHRAADGVEGADARIAQVGEDQFPGAPGGDHLIIDQVRRHPAQGQVAAALADDLVPSGEADAGSEALDSHRVAIVDISGDGIMHGDNFHGILLLPRSLITADVIRSTSAIV